MIPSERQSRPVVTRAAGVEVACDDSPTVPDACDVAAHVERESAYRAGYEDGFAAGWDVGAGRVVLGLEHALGGLPDLLATPLLDVAGERFTARYAAERTAAYADPVERCDLGKADLDRPPAERRGHRCSTCSRVAAREENRRQWGGDDLPPADVRALLLMRRLAEGARAS